MKFVDHSKLKGQHAFLSASKYSWLNYSEDQVMDAYEKRMAQARGVVLHDFAARCITLNQRLPKSKKTLNSYVNDAIGFKMTPEQVLYYSDNCYGTADAICFRDMFFADSRSQNRRNSSAYRAAFDLCGSFLFGV